MYKKMAVKGFTNLFLSGGCLLLSLGLTGCKDEKVEQPITIRKTKGDPYVFVKNSAMNGQTSSLPAEVFVKGEKDKWEMSLSAFVEEAPENINQKLDEQDPDHRGSPSAPDNEFEVKIVDSKLILQPTDKKNPFQLEFVKNEDGSVKFERLLMRGEPLSEPDYTVETLHYSWSAENNMFSLLLRMTGREKALLRFNFSGAVEKSFLEHVGEKLNYNYIFGNSLRIAWDINKKVPLQVCGLSGHSKMIEMVEKSARTWSNVLDGDLQIEVVANNSCPPYSDLNSHNFWIVDDWIEVVGQAGTLGATMAIPQILQGRIVDADVFLLRSEMLEGSQGDPDDLYRQLVQNPRGYRYLYSTILHELGHFIGLDHTDFNDEGLQSIMSYNDSAELGVLYAYDIGALRELYAHQERKTQRPSSEQTSHSRPRPRD